MVQVLGGFQIIYKTQTQPGGYGHLVIQFVMCLWPLLHIFVHEEGSTRIRLLRVTDCSIIDLMNMTISGYMEFRETEKTVLFIHSDIL